MGAPGKAKREPEWRTRKPLRWWVAPWAGTAREHNSELSPRRRRIIRSTRWLSFFLQSAQRPSWRTASVYALEAWWVFELKLLEAEHTPPTGVQKEQWAPRNSDPPEPALCYQEMGRSQIHRLLQSSNKVAGPGAEVPAETENGSWDLHPTLEKGVFHSVPSLRNLNRSLPKTQNQSWPPSSQKPFTRRWEGGRGREGGKKEESWIWLCLRKKKKNPQSFLFLPLCATDVHHLFGDKALNVNWTH